MQQNTSGQMKDLIRKQNITADTNIEQLFKLPKRVLENVTVNKWINYCRLTAHREIRK